MWISSLKEKNYILVLFLFQLSSTGTMSQENYDDVILRSKYHLKDMSKKC